MKDFDDRKHEKIAMASKAYAQAKNDGTIRTIPEPDHTMGTNDPTVKWTQEFIWQKIESVVPTARVSGNSIQEALNRAAVELFLLAEVYGSYRSYVIQTCIDAIRQNGYIEFGLCDEDWVNHEH